jgi:lipopolysaccharide transport system ATP-binding protein
MPVIQFEHVSKAYQLGAGQASLREALTRTPRRLFGQDGRQEAEQLLWALDDVSFQVEPAEVLGLIGPNGAGKSTILKLLSRVTFPTCGHVRTRGRMAALIELGAGFHPELSGRENIYLNGAILGLKMREIQVRFSSIVEFAELERFIDTPVKRYSSGMYVRLAFAIAAHVRAELILVDEVLSVGDLAFQQKCLDKMNQLRNDGATIVFVSHNLWSVGKFCNRALLLRKGKIVAQGTPHDVIRIYKQQERENLLSRTAPPATPAAPSPRLGGVPPAAAGDPAITQVELLDQAGQPKEEFAAGDRLLLRAHYVVPRPIQAPVFLVRITRPDGVICCALSTRKNTNLAQKPTQGTGTFEACIGPLQLVPNTYTVEVCIVDRHKPIIHATNALETFRVEGPWTDKYAGVFRPPVEWRLNQPDGSAS